MILPYRDWRPNLGVQTFVAPGARLIGRLTAGDHCSFWYNVVVRADVMPITLGARVNVQDGTVIHVTRDRFATTIGDDVTIGHSAVLHGCTVERLCLIGMGALVLDGAVIGEQSIIGAGALVTPGTIIPPRSLAVGSPARVRRELSLEELDSLRRSADQYVAYAAEHMASLQETTA